MFTIPSLWNIVISTIMFVIAAWYLHRKLDEYDMPRGFTRGLLVFVLAYVVSYASGELVDWSREKMFGPEPVSESQRNLNSELELLRANGNAQP